MAEIISIDKVSTLSKNLKKQDKKIVLAGGCFDILHPGHVIFLEKSQKSRGYFDGAFGKRRKSQGIKGC